MGIRKLARELNLSIGTVSRALNDRPDVNPETRARVKAAAAMMNYVPDQSGRSLRLGETGMVAAVVPAGGFSAFNTNAIFFDMMDGFRNTLIRHGIEAVILMRSQEEDGLEHLKKIISRRIVDGIVITRIEPMDARITHLRDAGIKFVTFGRSDGLTGYDWVDYDIGAAAAEATDTMIRSGHRSIGVVLNDMPLNYLNTIADAVRARAAAAGLGSSAVRDYRVNEQDALAQIRAIRAEPDAPSAYLALNDGLSAAIYRASNALGLDVGRQTALIRMMPSVGDQSEVPGLSTFTTDNFITGTALARRFLPAYTEAGGPINTLIPLSFRRGTSHVVESLLMPSG